jgi:predicted acetyltransferase
MPRDVDARLAEFFVAQPYRRRGIGRAAALATLARFPGTWVLEVVTGNDAALAFWRAVTGEATGGDYAEEERPGDTVQRFTIGG